MNTERCNICVRSDQLTFELLDTFPVWGSFDNDDSEMVRPVLDDDPFKVDCDPLTIKSKFVTVDDIEIIGCIHIERAYDEVYMVDFFVGGNWVGFNRHLVDLAEQDLAKLKSLLGDSTLKVFPVRFETQMRHPAKNFGGTFTPFV